jgi:hypothetical protein
VAQEAQRLATRAGGQRGATAQALSTRITELRRLGLSRRRPEALQEMITEVEQAHAEAQALLADTSVAKLEEERRWLQQRLRAIAVRLAEIDEELKRVEELVIAGASVVATTLARAYKRESVQQRTFDTVILDLAREQGLAGAGEVIAGTAHTFQGNEAPVVIFDVVNDEPHRRVGMFDPRRDPGTMQLLNVALTRAQRRLIVVGDFAWIERQARRGFLHQLVAELKATSPVVEARTILPSRAATCACQGCAS